jgi:sugar phosphate isomerase/epimerase
MLLGRFARGRSYGTIVPDQGKSITPLFGPRRVKFAICNETFVDWPFDRAFAFAAECGYTGIEIAPFTMDHDARKISPAQRQEVRRLAQANGLAVVGLHWLLAKTEGFHLTSPEASIQRRTADYLADLVRLCRDVEGTILVLGSPQQRNLAEGVSPDQGLRYAAEVLSRVVPVLDDCGATLAIEPLGPAEGNFLLTAAQGIELIRLVDSPRCRLHLDVKAMCSEPDPIDRIIETSREHLVHFHANDPNKLGPGMGQVEFQPIFKALKKIDYQGWVSVEVFDYSPGPEKLARDSIRYMRDVLDQIAAG